ncbi:hypothetical protein FKM82_018175 [Ascaphus truei]
MLCSTATHLTIRLTLDTLVSIDLSSILCFAVIMPKTHTLHALSCSGKPIIKNVFFFGQSFSAVGLHQENNGYASAAKSTCGNFRLVLLNGKIWSKGNGKVLSSISL